MKRNPFCSTELVPCFVIEKRKPLPTHYGESGFRCTLIKDIIVDTFASRVLHIKEINVDFEIRMS